MRFTKHVLMGLLAVVFLCGIVGILHPATSAAADFFKDKFVTNKELKDLILMLKDQIDNLPESGPCAVPPSWGGVIPGDQRFVPTFVEGDTVYAYCDQQTGLVWDAEPEDTTFTWNSARDHCISRIVSWNGQMGGRLPSIPELASLVDTTSSTCSFEAGGSICLPDGHPFSNVQLAGGYWSASTLADTPTHAWILLFGDAFVDTNDKGITNHAWCVRGAMDADAY